MDDEKMHCKITNEKDDSSKPNVYSALLIIYTVSSASLSQP